MNEINGVKVPFIPIVGNDSVFTPPAGKSKESFASIFNGELEKLSFSGHAMKRLESRDIQLDETTMGALQNAVDKAEAKGAKDSLVMMNDMAFIVNVPNRTVVTAMKIAEKQDAVFTNIDSVVFA
jgi:flagellar operon protein